MIGVLVITHGDFAKGLLNSVELIMGKPKKCKYFGLYHGDSIELFGKKVLDSIIELDEGEGVLVFSDLYCASPYNTTAVNSKYLIHHKYRSICGINLPMILEALNTRDSMELDELAEYVMKCGKDGIKEFFDEMKKANIKNYRR